MRQFAGHTMIFTQVHSVGRAVHGRLLFTLALTVLLTSGASAAELVRSDPSVERLEVESGYFTAPTAALFWPADGCADRCVDVARGDAESVMLRLSAREYSVHVASISLRFDSDDAPPVEVSEIDNLYGHVEESGETTGPYPDVVRPLRLPLLVDPSVSRQFLLTVRTGQDQRPGVYRGEVVLAMSDRSLRRLPISVQVLPARIPEKNALGTYLFGLDTKAIRYWYGVTPSEPRYAELMDSYLQGIQQFRVVPANFPRYDKVDPAGFPVRLVDAERHQSFLRFDKDKSLVVKAPRFELLGDTFALDLTARLSRKGSAEILSYRWANADAGFELVARGRTLVLETWMQTGVEEVEPVELRTEFPFETWFDVTIRYDGNTVSLWIDGSRQDSATAAGPLTPAYGGELRLMSEKNRTFDFGGLRWRRSGAPDDRMPEFDYRPSDFDIERLRRSDSVESPPSWSDEVEAHAAREMEDYNRLVRLEEAVDEERVEQADLDQATGALGERTAYVRLPHDERASGWSGIRNMRWAGLFKLTTDDIRILHSFGNLSGKYTKRQEKIDQLNLFSPVVDIYTMRAQLTRNYAEPLAALQEEHGIEVAPYVHGTDRIEREASQAVGRAYFWKLFAEDFDATTYWRMNLWYQPWRSARPARYIKSVEDGFLVSSRNPASIATGMVIYPGTSGPLFSLRMHAWRDGIEDYELLKRVAAIATRSGESKLQQRARALIGRVSDEFGFDKVQWYVSDEAELERMFSHRTEAMAIIGAESTSTDTNRPDKVANETERESGS